MWDRHMHRNAAVPRPRGRDTIRSQKNVHSSISGFIPGDRKYPIPDANTGKTGQGGFGTVVVLAISRNGCNKCRGV